MPSLFARLIGLIALVLFLGAMMLGWAAWTYARIAADEAYDRLLVGAALQIAESVAAEPGRVSVDPPISAFETLAMAVDDRIFYRVVDPRGETLTGQEDLAPARSGSKPGREPVLAEGVYRGFPIRVVTLGRFITGPDTAGWVDVTVAQTQIARLGLARDLTFKALLLVLGMSAFALLGVVIAVRRALRPLDQVEAALQARDPKDLSPVELATPREIRPLIEAINHFLGRLSERINGMERFIADAAHQIRTPLTALAAQVDLLSTETRAERRRSQIYRVRERTDQLGRLTSQLLSHAMVIHRREVVRLEPVDLVPLVRAALAEAVPLSLDRDIRIAFETEKPALVVAGDQVSIREAVANVIHNAIRHGAPTELSVALSEAEAGMLIAIEDDGPGVPEAHWPEIVKPFVRGLGRDAGSEAGSGLGLAIAADVLAAHGGGFTFGFGRSGRFVVGLRFPKPEAEPNPEIEPKPDSAPRPAARRPRPPATARPLLLALVLAAMAAFAPEPRAQETTTVFPAPGGERQVLLLHTATDLEAFEPLLRGFQRIAPDVTIRYTEAVTNALFDKARQDCAARRASADLLITSSVDHLVVLSNEGCARQHRSVETASAPAWTRWRDEVFGFTFEPAVIVYNRALVPQAEVPRTRVDLINLMREQPTRYSGRIGAYDIALSGIGYLFATFDGRNALIYGRLIEGFGRMKLVTRCCTSDLVKELAEGKISIGYNLLGSYAYAAQKKGAPIGIVVPQDYVLALSRGAMIPAQSPNPALAQRFLDFLLSPAGQKIIREEAFFFDFSGRLPEGVEGPPALMEAGIVRPIVIGPGLLPVQDKAKRRRFLDEWRRSIDVKADAAAAPAPASTVVDQKN